MSEPPTAGWKVDESRGHDHAGVHVGFGSGEVVARFEVRRQRALDADGSPVGDDVDEPREVLQALYRGMVRARTLDARAVALQRTGRLGTYASCLGQEAVGVGAASAMEPDDVLVPSFREHAAQLWRGVTPLEFLLYWGGDERGSDFAVPRGDFPICLPIASHAPHAVGAGLAMRLRGEPRVAECVLGDGATSIGDFAEAVNAAGAMSAHVLFLVVDNGWAISLPRARQTAAGTLAQKAIAAGIPGVQVDGNDVIAVRRVVLQALEGIRQGQGPALVEALTYRLADHTTADDARRYRDDAQVRAAWGREPVHRLRAFLAARGWWSDADEAAVLSACRDEVDGAAQEYLDTPAQPPEAMFDHLVARPSASLTAQREAVGGEGNDA